MNFEDHWNAEKSFWLDGPDFYEKKMAPYARMVFPAPVGILEGKEILAGLKRGPGGNPLISEKNRKPHLAIQLCWPTKQQESVETPNPMLRGAPAPMSERMELGSSCFTSKRPIHNPNSQPTRYEAYVRFVRITDDTSISAAGIAAL